MPDLKAWVVQDLCREYAEVVFAETRGKAKVAGMAEFEKDDWQFTEMLARRRPEFDEYAGVGKVPLAAKFANGWGSQCMACEYGEFTQKDIDAGDAVLIGESIYCLECAGKRGVRIDHA